MINATSTSSYTVSLIMITNYVACLQPSKTMSCRCPQICLITSFLKMFCVCSVFCPASTDDEARDLVNQKRIRSFNWITPQHLDAAINPDSDKVQQLIEDAQQGNV